VDDHSWIRRTLATNASRAVSIRTARSIAVI
jgi:hypothetical protein